MKLYDELAPWWRLMSPAAEYAEEAAFYLTTLRNAARQPIHMVLELGSGGGNNASHMKRHFNEMVLVDLSPGMLATSRVLNPDLAHHHGDMRTVRLGREFDAVFVHDAVCYMTTETDLRQAIETAFVHCKPGGVALFCPDYIRENFAPATEHGGVDEDGRGMRWLSWQWQQDPDETTYFVDYAYLLRDNDGSVRVVYDRHIEGLFPRDTWLRLFNDVGFTHNVLPFEHSDLEPGKHEVFLCIRPKPRAWSRQPTQVCGAQSTSGSRFPASRAQPGDRAPASASRPH
jgi:SAM-dependent methyltransferase